MDFVLKIKRAETQFYAALKRMARSVIYFDLPFWRPWGLFLRQIYISVRFFIETLRQFRAFVFYGPVFKSYCVSCGRNLYLELVPSVAGPVKIVIGNSVRISGALAIASGHVFDARNFASRTAFSWGTRYLSG